MTHNALQSCVSVLEEGKNKVLGLCAQICGLPEDEGSPAVESILVPWFAYQNQSALAAEALVESVVNLYRQGWSVQQVQMELAFLSLSRQSEGMHQIQELDSDMLLSFVLLISITCEVRARPRRSPLIWLRVRGASSAAP